MSKSKLAEALVRAVRAPIDAASARFDAWVNHVTGFGTHQDKTTFGEILPSRLLSDVELSSLYHSDDMAERMIDVYPNEMLREGFTIETGDPGSDATIADVFEGLDVCGNFTDGIRWGRLFGGGAVLIGADDGRDAAKPLVPERAKSISFLHAFDRRLLWPISYYEEDGHPKLGQAETYLVTREGGTVSQVSVVHESRLIIFPGAPTAARERQMLNGWDQSYLQRAYEVLRSFNTGWKSVETMMTDGNQPVFKMTGLADMIASQQDGEKALMKRLQMMSLYRSVMRALVIDADSNESFERTAASFTEIPNVLQQLCLRLAATQAMPVTMLMGQSPAGMSATGDSDFRWFYNRVDSQRKNLLVPRLRRLVKIFLATKQGQELVKTQPKTLQIKFPDLWKETPLASAQRRLAIIQGDAALAQAQVVLPDEIALQRFGAADGMEGELRLSPESIKAREKALTADLDQLAAGKPPEDDEDGGPPGGGGPPFGGKPSNGGAQPRFDGAMRRFELHRHEDETGVSGTGNVADGCLFEDGLVVVRWRTKNASTTVFEPKDGRSGIERMLGVHGHGGKTELRYVDSLVPLEEERRLDAATDPNKLQDKAAKKAASAAKEKSKEAWAKTHDAQQATKAAADKPEDKAAQAKAVAANKDAAKAHDEAKAAWEDTANTARPGSGQFLAAMSVMNDHDHQSAALQSTAESIDKASGGGGFEPSRDELGRFDRR